MNLNDQMLEILEALHEEGGSGDSNTGLYFQVEDGEIVYWEYPHLVDDPSMYDAYISRRGEIVWQ